MNLFGYSIIKKAEKGTFQSFSPPSMDDGSVLASTGWSTGSYLDLDVGSSSESELINKYRDISMYPDCDTAIEEIINECISVEDSDDIIDIDLEQTKLPLAIKNLITEEFGNVLELLHFRTHAHDLMKQWYVDGKIYFHKILDPENPQNGIVELRPIDPRKIKRIKQVQKQLDPNTGSGLYTTLADFYLYNDSKSTNVRGSAAPSNSMVAGTQIAIDSIACVNSGLMDNERNIVIGFLHKVIKPCNQLRMIEDAVVINTLVRAPLRRIFNVYTGNLPPNKQEQHVQETANRFRNKVNYNVTDGSTQDSKKFLSMLEDYWFAQSKDGHGTTVENLPGGGEIANDDKMMYFQKKLYQSLNVPFSRLQNEGGINFGHQTEISKEELKFAKYINRLRRKFSELFSDILCSQLITKGILTYDDWEQISKNISYKFNSDIYWQETKKNDLLRDKMELISMVDPYVGKYFSKDYIDKEILGLSEEDQEEMNDQMGADYQVQMQQQVEQMKIQQGASNNEKENDGK